MNLFNYDKGYIAARAEELGFIRDTLEKVYRLADILEYLNSNPLLRESLGLKGGTAINLTIFNLPRLSIDIDLDFLKNVSREEMLQEREKINEDIFKYMQTKGYSLNPRTKNPHSLDSWVFDYINIGGNRDNIKIEINYSMRAHILPSERRNIITENFKSEYKVNSLAAIEVFASKINALLSRGAARDLYDMNNLVYYELFDESQYSLLRKCVVFYAAVSAKIINKSFDTTAINKLSKYKIRTDLLPVIRRKESFDLETAKTRVATFIDDLMKLTPEEKLFLDYFEEKQYKPELLFDDNEILDRIKNHPT